MFPMVMGSATVRALLAGTKTRTRRLAWRADGEPSQWQDLHARVQAGKDVGVWVREAHTFDAHGAPIYRATTERTDVPRWRSPIHMPWRICRLTLAVTATRLEPLTAISEADAEAEGAAPGADGSHRDGYRALWESLHGAGAWDTDPEVVVIAFTVHAASEAAG